MVVVCVLGVGRLGGNIAGDLAFNGHTVRVWDSDKNSLDKLNERLAFERKRLRDDRIMLYPDFLGDVYCLSTLEDALIDAEIVIEAIHEDLEDKQKLIERVSKLCKPPVILASSSLRISLDEITEHAIFRERCVGLRFLYPVFCIPEVEITKSKHTNLATIETCIAFLERCGKTAFFRSGTEPMILNEDQRLERRKGRAEVYRQNRTISGRSHYLVPKLAHAGNFAPAQDDSTAKRRSALDAECVICMDRQRGCILSPCHHLCTCACCGELLVDRKDACPICRRGITQTIPYFSS